MEKQKLVYILNRDAAARLTISSPLEAHKSHTLVYHTVGVDVGFENPMFACLEMDYEVKIRTEKYILNLLSFLYLVTECSKRLFLTFCIPGQYYCSPTSGNHLKFLITKSQTVPTKL